MRMSFINVAILTGALAAASPSASCTEAEDVGELVLPDGQVADNPEDRQAFLSAYVAITMKSHIVIGRIDAALEMLQIIIDARSEELGYDVEEYYRNLKNQNGDDGDTSQRPSPNIPLEDDG